MDISKHIFNKEAGKRIRSLREYQHFTREKLAEYADTSVQFIADIECGRKGMTTYTLYKISNALHVSADYIIYGKKNSNDDAATINILIETLETEHREIAEQILQLYVQAVSQTKHEKKAVTFTNENS